MKETSKYTIVYHLCRDMKKTCNAELAILAAKKTGRKPIEFISDRVRATYLKAIPELGRKVKK
jgi:hypothetical protein